MMRVIIESPWAGDTDAHADYLRRCLVDSLGRGEAPFASHRMYVGALDDADPDQRALGIAAGYAWGQDADEVAVYADLGISRGMSAALRHYWALGLRVTMRTIGAEDGWTCGG